jgi:hypothetical protein
MVRLYWMALTLAILAVFALCTNWFALDLVNDANRTKPGTQLNGNRDKNVSPNEEKPAKPDPKTELSSIGEAGPDDYATKIELDTQNVEKDRICLSPADCLKKESC